MLNQAVNWVDIAGTLVDCFLLLRVVSLRLHRVYAFLTLYCVLNPIIDIAAWVNGFDSPAAVRIFFYTRFLMAIVLPLASWDVFEEMKKAVSGVRRLHGTRLVSGVFLTALLAFLFSFQMEDKEFSGMSATTAQIAMFLWLGSASASLVFVWNLYRLLRKQGLALPRNSYIWALFMMITLAFAIASCGLSMAGPDFSKTVGESIDLVSGAFGLGLAFWCAVMLRRLPSDLSVQTHKASS